MSKSTLFSEQKHAFGVLIYSHCVQEQNGIGIQAAFFYLVLMVN